MSHFEMKRRELPVNRRETLNRYLPCAVIVLNRSIRLWVSRWSIWFWVRSPIRVEPRLRLRLTSRSRFFNRAEVLFRAWRSDTSRGIGAFSSSWLNQRLRISLLIWSILVTPQSSGSCDSRSGIGSLRGDGFEVELREALAIHSSDSE